MRFARVPLFALLLLTQCKQQEEPEPDSKAPPPAPSPHPPEILYLPDDFHADDGAPRELDETRVKRRCPEEMVQIADAFCIDRYETSLLDRESSQPLSPHYPPTRYYTNLLFERFQRSSLKPRRGPAALLELPTPPEFQLIREFNPQASSRPGVLPAGYLTKHTAEEACQNAGKRLCTRQEWITACRGQDQNTHPYGARYEEGACNVHRKSHPARLLHGDASKHHLDPRLNLTGDTEGPLLRKTGETPTCVSVWGEDRVYDMVGNIDEWIDEASGTFLGGFYSRGTTAGCFASIEVHSPDYLDYSLGTRCCDELD